MARRKTQKTQMNRSLEWSGRESQNHHVGLQKPELGVYDANLTIVEKYIQIF